MIKNTTVMARPNTETEFWAFAPIVQEYVNATYISTGKLSYGGVSVSDDNLTRNRTALWRDQLSLDEYVTDPIIKQAYRERKAYCVEHKHTVTSTNVVLNSEE